MNFDPDAGSARTALFLKQLGIRATRRAYSYLLFALTQMQQGSPFRDTIWELTAIYFHTTRKNVMACVRRELSQAFQKAPDAFKGLTENDDLTSPPRADAFLRLACLAVSPIAEAQTEPQEQDGQRLEAAPGRSAPAPYSGTVTHRAGKG